ncbi:hypothetical protein GTU71_02475 [Rathayibacter sp. VKM Ac-2762]|uniref:hypothetical protein n=1 Tax=Rathayibacter sp. VKM Ac-2762 TaxID=2609254 RepID=UPI00132EF8DB|nr:hypothetical protein [Rathayibacter sp. VKM Ac-2762]QHF19834.1 hypothetical protein GTU71_02475 [Rathayibacter sp. VKM Ac-2762]
MSESDDHTIDVSDDLQEADEPLGGAGLAALHSERDARKAAEKRLEEFEDRHRVNAEQIEAAEARVRDLEIRALRGEIALVKGVPAALLSGDTQADMEASADAVLQFRSNR